MNTYIHDHVYRSINSHSVRSTLTADYHGDELDETKYISNVHSSVYSLLLYFFLFLVARCANKYYIKIIQIE